MFFNKEQKMLKKENKVRTTYVAQHTTQKEFFIFKPNTNLFLQSKVAKHKIF